VAAFYLLSPRVVRGVRYGPAPRNYLDLYLPRAHLHTVDAAALRPVIVYVTGERCAALCLRCPALG
jgi:hypothetical protein